MNTSKIQHTKQTVGTIITKHKIITTQLKSNSNTNNGNKNIVIVIQIMACK